MNRNRTGWTGSPTGSIQIRRFNFILFLLFLQYQNDIVLKNMKTLHWWWRNCRPQHAATSTPAPTGGLPGRYTIATRTPSSFPPRCKAPSRHRKPPAPHPPPTPRTHCNRPPPTAKPPLDTTNLSPDGQNASLENLIVCTVCLHNFNVFFIIIMILCLIFHFYKKKFCLFISSKNIGFSHLTNVLESLLTKLL